MNIFQRLLLKAAGVSFSTTDSRIAALLGPSFAAAGGTSRSGQFVSADAAMQLSVAWSCMRVLSETIGSVPWALYERDEGGNATRVREGDALADLIAYSPNADMTSVEFREAMILNLCQGGNAYALKTRASGGSVTALYPLEWPNVEPKRRADGTVYYLVTDANGNRREYAAEDIWHVKGFGRNGLVGLSPIGAAREALGMAMAAEQFGAAFFAQGGKPSGIVSIPNWLTNDQRTVARNNLEQMMGGVTNAHKFALFEGGMKPEPWGAMPLDDMEFVALRKFSVAEICRFYRVPPHMVADLDRATFSNIEQMSQEFVQFTLLPYFTRIEWSFAKNILTPAQRSRMFLRFNFEGLLRADSAGRSAFYSTMVQNGIMTRNEIRAKENLNRSDEEGMDDFTAQTNLSPIDKLGAPAPAASGGAFSSPPSRQRSPGADGDEANGAGDAGTKAINVSMPAPQSAVTVTLPESVAKDARYTVEHPGIVETVKRMRASEDRLVRRMENLEKATAFAVQSMNEEMLKAVKEMARVAKLPRKPVYHSDGEIAGAIPVEELDVH